MMYPKRKKAEEDLLRVNRALKALSRCNQAIIYIQDENELLNEICHIIVEIGGYRLAWVGYAEDDDYKSVHPVAQVGFEDGYLETLQITWADQERGRGPTGTAIRTGEASIVKNIHENGRFAPWREEAKKRDYASSIAIPLKSEGKTFGAMNIYSAKADAFNEEEVRLLTELADDLAYGISSTRTREARKRAENISQARLRLLEFAISHSMDELLTASLDEIEAMTGSVIGFYHFLEPDQKTLISQNWSTNTLKNMCTAKGKGSHYDIEQAGVWVDCISEGRPVIHNDYTSLPHRKGMPDGHAQVIRELVVPIFRGNLIKAIIGVGNKSIDYTENDIEIVSQLGDLSFDIVERKLIAKELQWERDFVKTLIDNAKVIIGVLDMDDRFVLVNPYMEDVTGYKFSELQGKSWIETLFPKPDQMRAKEHFKSVINDWDSSPQTFPIVTKDGSIRSIEWYDSLLKDIEGNTTGLLVIGLDITERKEAEEELTRHRHHLEELVKERSAEIIKINEELREANLRLQEADRLKDVFLASMSHELR
ncbi:GAF domain-containing protein, partial [bacterium]|nr:GAF domain-containing protein [bacterium]